MAVTELVQFSLAMIWILFFVYWTGSVIYESATGKNKRVERSDPGVVLLLIRLPLYVSVILAFTAFNLQRYYPLGLSFLPNSIIVTYIGLSVALLGILFAIWARMYLGSNWSPDPEVKKGHVLIKSGPYGIVRHPIYTGMTIGMIGSAIAENVLVGLIAVLFMLIFSYLRIIEEEKFMKGKFGKQYVDYAKTVKTFMPWIW